MSNDFWYGPLTVLQRKTPLRRKTFMRRISKRRLAERMVYISLRKFYLKEHPYCEFLTCLRPATQIHHKKGCYGAMLNDTRWWLAVCQQCHTWIENHKNEARSRGLILYK